MSRLYREIEFHRHIASAQSHVQPTAPTTRERYLRNRNWRVFPKEFIYHQLGDLRGQQVLDVGCGVGHVTVQLANLGAEVTGIDLSPDLVDIARRQVEADGLAHRVRLFVGDAETAELPANSYDAVVMLAILHHTDYHPVLASAVRALRPGGRAFIAEPVTLSRTLSWLRDRSGVPKIASPDERQLTREDIDAIRGYFTTSNIRYFHGLGRLQRLFIGEPIRPHGRLAWWATLSVHYLDRLLFALPGARRTAGVVVIEACKA
jgi:SAM-dependent methyltransferase